MWKGIPIAQTYKKKKSQFTFAGRLPLRVSVCMNLSNKSWLEIPSKTNRGFAARLTASITPCKAPSGRLGPTSCQAGAAGASTRGSSHPAASACTVHRPHHPASPTICFLPPRNATGRSMNTTVHAVSWSMPGHTSTQPPLLGSVQIQKGHLDSA